MKKVILTYKDLREKGLLGKDGSFNNLKFRKLTKEQFEKGNLIDMVRYKSKPDEGKKEHVIKYNGKKYIQYNSFID